MKITSYFTHFYVLQMLNFQNIIMSIREHFPILVIFQYKEHYANLTIGIETKQIEIMTDKHNHIPYSRHDFTARYPV